MSRQQCDVSKKKTMFTAQQHQEEIVVNRTHLPTDSFSAKNKTYTFRTGSRASHLHNSLSFSTPDSSALSFARSVGVPSVQLFVLVAVASRLWKTKNYQSTDLLIKYEGAG